MPLFVLSDATAYKLYTYVDNFNLLPFPFILGIHFFVFNGFCPDSRLTNSTRHKFVYVQILSQCRHPPRQYVNAQ